MDENHAQMLAEGWSWIELMGGPRDGEYSYFKGSPAWVLYFIDPSIDPAYFRPGDVEHCYELTAGASGHAIYQWQGTFRRP